MLSSALLLLMMMMMMMMMMLNLHMHREEVTMIATSCLPPRPLATVPPRRPP